MRAAYVSSHTVEDALECEAMLKPHGLRLLDALRDFIAARHYGALLEDRAKSWTVDEAAQTWMASREGKGRSDGYLWDAQRRLARFRTRYGSTSLADITTAMVDAWVNELRLGPQSMRNYLTVLSSMFSYAVKQGRSPSNPVMNVERPDVVRDEPGILKPEECVAVCELLEDCGWIIGKPAGATAKGGRPTTVYRVNPRAGNR